MTKRRCGEGEGEGEPPLITLPQTVRKGARLSRVHYLPRFCESFFNVVTQNLTQRNSLLLNLCNEMFIFQGLEAGDFRQGWRPSIAPPPPPEGPWDFMGGGGD